MRTLAILPVKRFELAKTRLGGALDPPTARRASPRRWSPTCSTRCARAPRCSTASWSSPTRPAVAALAQRAGASVLADPPSPARARLRSSASRQALAEGYERALLVPGDCPALDAARR